MIDGSKYNDLLGIPYKYTAGPYLNRNGEIPSELNCQLFAHLLLERITGMRLAPWLLSQEIYNEQGGFYAVEGLVLATAGDVFLFGGNEHTRSRNLHLAVNLGGGSPENPLLIHANFPDRRVAIWEFKRFMKSRRYPFIAGIRRFNPSLG